MSTTPPRDTPLRIAGCLVQPQLHRIDCGDRQIGVEPKILAVLLRLAETPGEVVTREELLETVWNGDFVSDDVITRAITELRRVFDDDARTPQVIETIRKRGYRLIAPVEHDLATSSPPALSRESLWHLSRNPILWLASGVLLGVGGLLVAASLYDGEAPAAVPVDREASSLRVAPLTSDPGQERDPAVSPDGQRVAYVDFDSAGSADLWLATRRGEGRRQLTRGEDDDRYPVWSADGTRLAFVRLAGPEERGPGDGDTEETCTRMTVDTVGGAERRIVECDPRSPLRMDWSPDGRSLAIVERTPNGPWGIFLLDLETLASRQVTEPRPPARGDVEPAFSPDGRLIAFTRALGPMSADLHTVRLSDLVETRLTHDHRDIIGQAFVADGASILFSSDRAGSYGLWQVASHGGAPRFLAGSGNKIKHPSHARQAPVVAWEDWRFEIAIVAQPLVEGGVPRPVVESTQWDFAPALSPDGDRLAFVSSRSGAHQLWTLELEDGGDEATDITTAAGARRPVQLTHDPLQVTSAPSWSPDGRRIAFAAMIEGAHDLWLLELGAVVARRLGTGAAYVRSFSWAEDGRSLYYTAELAGTQPALFRLELPGSPPRDAGARVRPLLENVLSVRESGGALLLVRSHCDGLWTMPAAEPGVEPALVTGDLPRSAAANWELLPASGRDAVLWVATDGGADWAFVFERGAGTRRMIRLAEHARSGIAVSADGATLYYSTPRNAESDLLLGENLMAGRDPLTGSLARLH